MNIKTSKVQKCGCEEDDCVEILGLETPIYACFTCGYAGVTPSGSANQNNEIHVSELRTEVKQLREVIEQHGIGISFDPEQSDRDALILYWWGEATSQGYWGSVYEYKVMAEEEE